MTQPDAKIRQGSPHRWRRALVVLAVIAVVAMAVWLFRAPILSSIVRRVARANGIEARWSDLELDGLSHISIQDLSLKRDPDIDVRADRVEAWLDPVELARGDLAGLHRLSATAVELDVGPFVRRKPRAAEDGAGAIRLPHALPDADIDLRRAVVRLMPDRRIELVDALVRIDDGRGVIEAARAGWHDRDVVVEHPLEVRVRWDGGVLTAERFAWDPRLTLEEASGDVRAAAEGRIDLAARMRGFEGSGSFELHMADGALALDARVRGLDVGAAARAYFAEPVGAIEARADLDAALHVPLAAPGETTGSATLAATGVRIFGRAFEIVEARARAGRRRIDVEHLFLSDGPNAAWAGGVLPRPPTDVCTLLEDITAWVDADVHDLALLLESDVGLASLRAEPGDAPVGPLRVTAAMGSARVEGRVAGADLLLEPLLLMFGVQAGARARVDVDAGVSLPLRDVRAIGVDALVDAVDIEYGGRHAELVSGRVRFEHGALALEKTVLVSGGNTLYVPLAQLPPLPIDPCTVMEHTTAQLRAELRDVPALLRGSEAAERIVEFPPHRLAFRATLIGDTLNVEDGSLTAAQNRVTVISGRVPLHDGMQAILFDDRLDLELDVDLQDAAAAARLLSSDWTGSLPIESGKVDGHARLRGGPAGPRGEIGLSADDLYVHDTRFDRVDVVAGIDEEKIDIARFEARSSLGTLSAEGRYTFADRRFEDARLAVDLSDLEQLAPGLPRGAMRIDAAADGPLEALTGEISVRANDLAWRDVLIEGFVLDAEADAGTIRIARAAGRVGETGFRLAGTAAARDDAGRQWRLLLDELVLRVVDETTSIAKPATIDVSADAVAVRGLVLGGAAGVLSADVSYESGVGCADVHAIGILPRLVLERLEMWLPRDTQLDADVSAQWEKDALTLVTRGHAQGTGLDPTQPSTATLAWDVSLSEKRLVIEELRLRGDPVTFRRARPLAPATATMKGSLPLDPFGEEVLPEGPLELTAAVEAESVSALPLPPILSGLRGALHASVDVKGDWSDVRGTVSIDAADFVLPSWNGGRGLGAASLDADLVLGDDIRVDRAVVRLDTTTGAPPAEIEGAGSIGAPLDVRAWRGGAPTSILDAPLDVSLRLGAADLAPLAARLPALRRTGGRADASLDITGTLRTPRIEGRASLEEGEIRTATNLPSILGVSAAVQFDGAKLVIDRLEGELGGAPFRMRGEIVVFDATPRMDLSFSGESILLWRQTDVTVRADADLQLTGPIDGLLLSGDLALRDARYTRKFDLLSLPARARSTAGPRGFQLFSLEEPPFSTMQLDLRLTSATPFVVANNILHAELSPDLRLRGTGELPELRGTAFIEPSRVLLPSGTLRVRYGRIEFRPDRPDVPVIEISATTRMQGYDIEINLSGPYDNPQVEVSSVPPLPREDVVLLVLTGRPPSNNLTLATGERAAVDVAVFIARDVAAAWLSGEGEAGNEESLAERLEVIVGADTTRSGADAVQVRLRLRGTPGERGAGLYATGERDVYDFYNFGLRLVYTFR